MEDSLIVELYFRRDESAILETQKKYSRYCSKIAHNILNNDEDADEAVNDTYAAAWDSIPPNRPAILSSYLGKLTRRIALKKLRERNAIKRGGGELSAAVSELEYCIPSGRSIDDELEAEEIAEIINSFLAKSSNDERGVFLRRYWYFESIKSIASEYGFSQSKVKMMLKRMRDRLRACLEKEGISL